MEDVVKELKTGRRFKVTEEAVIAEEKATIKGKAYHGRDVLPAIFKTGW